MTNLQMVFAIIAAIGFAAPFFIWGFIRFKDKQSRQVVTWHKPLIISSFLVGAVLFTLFILLAIFIQ